MLYTIDALMNRLVILLLICLTPCAIIAQLEHDILTVVAPSGLSLRNAPGQEAARITVIPKGAKVKVLDYDQVKDKNLESIDDYYGYWAHVSYQQQKGYVFSAYLYDGQPFVESTSINKDYRVFYPGWRCDPINYDPQLNWYAWTIDDQFQFTLEKKTPNFKMAGDSPYDIPPYAFCTAFEVGVKEQTTNGIFLFLGTQQALNLAKIDNGRTHLKPYGYHNSGVLPFPYQNQDFATYNEQNYYIIGYEDYIKSTSSGNGYRNYQLYLSTQRSDYFDIQPQGQLLSPLLKMDGYEVNEYTEYEAGYYQHARIVWQGDLNGDSFPDCLFYRPDISESCGGSEYYFLLLSEQQTDGTFLLKKVAEESVFSCS